MFTLHVNNFKALNVSWIVPANAGVRALTGGNGVGKSTLCQTLRFLQNLFLFDLEGATLGLQSSHFLRQKADPGEAVLLSLALHGVGITWNLHLPVNKAGFFAPYNEEVLYHGKLIHKSTEVGSWGLANGGYFINRRYLSSLEQAKQFVEGSWVALEPQEVQALLSLQSFLSTLQVHKHDVSRLDLARDLHRSMRLHNTGSNLWSILAQWKNAPITNKNRFEWVLDNARKAFPRLIESLEFDRTAPVFYPPNSESIPCDSMSQGLLLGLLHLTAVVSAEENSLVVIDNFDNCLSSDVKQSLVASLQEAAEQKNLAVILVTQDPDVLRACAGNYAMSFSGERNLEYHANV